MNTAAPAASRDVSRIAHELRVVIAYIENARSREPAQPALLAVLERRRDNLVEELNPAPPEPERLARLGALAKWRRELAAGKRDRSTFDVLARAACREASALELWALGLQESAQSEMERAAEIVLEDHVA